MTTDDRAVDDLPSVGSTANAASVSVRKTYATVNGLSSLPTMRAVF